MKKEGGTKRASPRAGSGLHLGAVKSAERALDVLALLTRSESPLTAGEIARSCGMPRSSTYQLLGAMSARRFVAYYEDQRAWGLGIAAFETGSAYLRAQPLEWLARSVLSELASTTGEIAHLAVLDGDEVVYLAKGEPPGGSPFLVTAAGVRLPAHLTAVGRAMLARLSPRALDAIFPPSRPLVRRTSHALATRAELDALLAEDRSQGYSSEEGSTTSGISCIAAPILSRSGMPAAAINVTFVSAKYTGSQEAELAVTVRHSAQALSRKLGWRPGAPQG